MGWRGAKPGRTSASRGDAAAIPTIIVSRVGMNAGAAVAEALTPGEPKSAEVIVEGSFARQAKGTGTVNGTGGNEM